MGQRANLVIVKKDGYDLYYNHWCANTLPESLFWGPEHAIAFIERQTKVDETGWLDDIWAEGGVLIDEACKLLLFFGGEDLSRDIPSRRLFLALMQTLWTGWEIRWANEGIWDISEYAGASGDKVAAKRDDVRLLESLAPPEEKNGVDTIGSLTFEDGEQLIYPLEGGTEGYLWIGPELAHPSNKVGGFEQFHAAEWTDNFPSSGFHLDVGQKRIDIWHAEVCTNLAIRLRERWSGWVICEHYDRYEVQIEKTEGRLQLHHRDRNKLLGEIEASLLRTPIKPVDELFSIVNHLESEGKEVKVNSFAVNHTTYEPPVHVREERLKFAIEYLDQQTKPSFQGHTGLQEAKMTKFRRVCKQILGIGSRDRRKN
ncbi:hypothetical protein GZH47_25055 [Paenibacillus rhizovicinus]|uniref:Uncharacterized protein n=1 Tax=Paenibacillus rhizovicinus TaxID=2704463 RepID=A0A6C0P5L5_9BACL|nr:hypothetical protein [Paenibacillus rhizovicinus]QHW33745.1 hypothetical protein GZH47_25055 [Paenibacillus rhizovicinus]